MCNLSSSVQQHWWFLLNHFITYNIFLQELAHSHYSNGGRIIKPWALYSSNGCAWISCHKGTLINSENHANRWVYETCYCFSVIRKPVHSVPAEMHPPRAKCSTWTTVIWGPNKVQKQDLTHFHHIFNILKLQFRINQM